MQRVILRQESIGACGSTRLRWFGLSLSLCCSMSVRLRSWLMVSSLIAPVPPSSKVSLSLSFKLWYELISVGPSATSSLMLALSRMLWSFFRLSLSSLLASLGIYKTGKYASFSSLSFIHCCDILFTSAPSSLYWTQLKYFLRTFSSMFWSWTIWSSLLSSQSFILMTWVSSFWMYSSCSSLIFFRLEISRVFSALEANGWPSSGCSESKQSGSVMSWCSLLVAFFASGWLFSISAMYCGAMAHIAWYISL